ncbi:MAG: hypothetical protein ACXWLF_09840, partial [Myxococcaceae bacterium]
GISSMRRSFALGALVAAAVLGCGGAGPDPRFGRTWEGTSTVEVEGEPPLSYRSELRVVVSGKTATVVDTCLDASASVPFTGDGTTLRWSGTLSCPGWAVSNCLLVTYEFRTGVLSLNAEGGLTLKGSGQATACGFTSPLTTTFVSP